jgi:hypothetical protein
MLADLLGDGQHRRTNSRSGRAATLWETPEKLAGTVDNGQDSKP